MEGLLGEQGQRLRLYFQNRLAVKFGDRDVLFAEQIVFGIVVRQRVKPPGFGPTVMNQNIMDIHG